MIERKMFGRIKNSLQIKISFYPPKLREYNRNIALFSPHFLQLTFCPVLRIMLLRTRSAWTLLLGCLSRGVLLCKRVANLSPSRTRSAIPACSQPAPRDPMTLSRETSRNSTATRSRKGFSTTFCTVRVFSSEKLPITPVSARCFSSPN